LKILFDHDVPPPLAQALGIHDVKTARQMGWDEVRNGLLLNAAEEAGFDVLITCDKNIPSQQNSKGRKIALFVLPIQNWPVLKGHAASIADRLQNPLPPTSMTITCRPSDLPQPDRSMRLSRSPRTKSGPCWAITACLSRGPNTRRTASSLPLQGDGLGIWPTGADRALRIGIRVATVATPLTMIGRSMPNCKAQAFRTACTHGNKRSSASSLLVTNSSKPLPFLSRDL
jgi:hypothetical protein